jgi:hypothetical protein
MESERNSCSGLFVWTVLNPRISERKIKGHVFFGLPN